jgi:hypothetical protein
MQNVKLLWVVGLLDHVYGDDECSCIGREHFVAQTMRDGCGCRSTESQEMVVLAV